MNNYQPQPPRLPVKKRIMLHPEHILRFFIGQDPQLDDLIIFHHEKFQITTTDFALYQALGSIKEYDDFNKIKLVKFLEVTTVLPQPKRVLTHERVSELRLKALKDTKNNTQ